MKRQSIMALWTRRVLGDESFKNTAERALRVVEEAIELAQALGVNAQTVHRLVDYVFARPVGDADREIGGVFVTMYAVAASLNVDADDICDRELWRIHQPEVEAKVRARQAEKRELAKPLPHNWVQLPSGDHLCQNCGTRRPSGGRFDGPCE